MYSGIIQEVGKVIAIDRKGDWKITMIAPQTTSQLELGASVACNGVCFTVMAFGEPDCFTVQASAETLSKTTVSTWCEEMDVNLERSMKFGDEIGGHLLAGHVDGLARVISRAEENDSIRFIFKVPDEYACYLAPKGSIALDGISLTVNDVNDSFFGVNIIPHTQKMTTFGLKQQGDAVNFEVDMIARYVGRMLASRVS